MRKYTNRAVNITISVFSLVSLLHFYWAFGGTVWYEDVLPTNSMGTNRLNPSPTAALLVAFGFLLMALVVVGTKGLFDKYLKRNYFRYATLVISLIFLLRAIGDFKFVGFFKTITHTRFGVNDTMFFSPICLGISVLTFYVSIFSEKKDAGSRRDGSRKQEA